MGKPNLCCQDINHPFVLVRALLLRTDTMTGATLMRTAFGWGWLAGSEVRFSVIKGGAWRRPGGHGAGGAGSSASSSEGR